MTISTSDRARPLSAEAIRRKAAELGFDAAGVASAALDELRRERLYEFLGAERHGGMAWMAARAEQRGSPTALWSEARSVVMVGMNYGPKDDPLEGLALRDRGAISVYARNRDYHDVIKPRLKSLARWMVHEGGGDAKVFVDTAPVMEKPLAAAAGLGWQGKHTNLVSRDKGSWLFLGALFTSLEIEPDVAAPDRCGACRRCLDICPTDAFVGPYALDARRCISYLTIEHKGPIPREFRAPMGNRIYGCDDCLAVCPWNKFATTAQESAFIARTDLESPSLAALSELDDAAFRSLFRKSPVKRTGRDRFIRNVLIAIGNSGAAALVPAARARLDDGAPLVRGAAVWALSRLLGAAEFTALANERAEDPDADVREEWRAAIAETAI